MASIRIQPKQLRDGTLPYPYFIGPDGAVGRQDFWRGRPAKLVGFSHAPKAGEMELHLSDFLKEPQQAVAMYPVFADDKDGWYTETNAIESVAKTK